MKTRAQVCVGLLLAALCASSCSWRPWARSEGPRPDRSRGVELVDADAVVGFLERADGFYGRLAFRRFNTLASYRDEALREYFRTDSSFSDYYADFAQALVDADFERNQPNVLDVTEFLFDGPGTARVKLRIVGDDGRPLRIGKSVVRREDRWERVGGTWWIVPGKL